MILELADLEKIGNSALQSFEERRAANPADTEWNFDLEVARLESQLTQLYAFAAMAARREESMEKTAQLWAAMVSICDAFAARVSALCREHPAGAASHDRILDLRNKCARLEQLHA